MLKIEPALLFVQVVTFGLAVFLLWRLFWKPLTRFMQQRSDSIERDLDEARTTNREAEELRAQLKTQLAEIDERAHALAELAREEGAKERDEMLRQARDEARRLVDNARREIAAERTRAVSDLRSETVALAVLIAEQAMKKSVDPEVQHRLVDEFTKELSHGS